jgi:hypothetical protein
VLRTYRSTPVYLNVHTGDENAMQYQNFGKSVYSANTDISRGYNSTSSPSSGSSSSEIQDTLITRSTWIPVFSNNRIIHLNEPEWRKQLGSHECKWMKNRSWFCCLRYGPVIGFYVHVNKHWSQIRDVEIRDNWATNNFWRRDLHHEVSYSLTAIWISLCTSRLFMMLWRFFRLLLILLL